VQVARSRSTATTRLLVQKVREVLRLWNFPEPFIERYLAGFAKAGFPLDK
jgi:hypothetical protein